MEAELVIEVALQCVPLDERAKAIPEVSIA